MKERRKVRREQFDPFIGLQEIKRKVDVRPIDRLASVGIGTLKKGFLQQEGSPADLELPVLPLFLPNSTKDSSIEELSKQIEASITERMEAAKASEKPEEKKGSPAIKWLIVFGGGIGVALVIRWLMKNNSIHKITRS